MNKQQLTVSFEGDELAAVLLLVIHRMEEMRERSGTLQEAERDELASLFAFVEKAYDCALSAILQKTLSQGSKDAFN